MIKVVKYVDAYKVKPNAVLYIGKRGITIGVFYDKEFDNDHQKVERILTLMKKAKKEIQVKILLK